MLTIEKRFSTINSLNCFQCGKEYSYNTINTYATCCNQPLTARYDPDDMSKDMIDTEDLTMWRYSFVLPVLNKKNIVSLGEGMTPILPVNKLAKKYNLSDVIIKDESFNPTGSFKARGISVAVSKAKEFNIKRCIIPTAGNAGGALAAYCAKSSIECTVVMPRNTPEIFKQECILYGATLILVDGLINDCAKKALELRSAKEYFDISTMKEPYRLEGKKTMGYEIAEQLNWELPAVIVYPAGGGTGLIGIWKAFKEMQQMGWISGPLPRMIAVQAANCASIEHAIKDRKNWKENFIPKASVANGLAVPYPFAMDMILQVLKESRGEVCSISEEDIIASLKEVAITEGMIISPEGAAAWCGVLKLITEKKIDPSEKILVLNTGTGYKYMNNIF
ncbi:MAG TPA: threonine synthase [Chitinophagaceae bacterium]|nr:threonine synthase [Chitinophagaceae bacterium]